MFQKYRKKIWLTLGIATLAAIVLACVLWFGGEEDALAIRFLDVGQGDAILISQGSRQLLIDGGRDPKRMEELLGEYIPFWDRTVDVIVATHPDEDHIGGLVGVFDRYYVGKFLRTRVRNDTGVFDRLLEVSKNTDTIETFAPLVANFPNGARLETVYPDNMLPEAEVQDTNATSVTMRLTFGNHSFLFTGDLPAEEEMNVLVGPTEVLKVGHHGSKYSTSERFLEKINPRYAVVSVGAKNRYGHPASEVMEKLKKRNVTLLRTDEEGTITFVCRKDVERCEVVTER